MKLVRYAATVALVVLVAACSTPSAQLTPPDATSPPTTSTEGPVPSPAPDVWVTGVKIPSIGVNESLTMQVDLNPDHTLGVPPLSSPRMVGWFRQSPVPGDAATGKYPNAVERSVLVGHINANHVLGVFADLSKVKVGAQLLALRSDNQTATFQVTKVLIVAKSAFPTATAYGGAKGPELVAITCGPGDLDTAQHNYLQQTLVFAKLVSLKPTGP